MSKKSVIAGMIIAVFIVLPHASRAVEPAGTAQQVIDRVAETVIGERKIMAKTDFDAVNILLVQARLALHEAQTLEARATTEEERKIAAQRRKAAHDYAEQADDYYAELLRLRALGLHSIKK